MRRTQESMYELLDEDAAKGDLALFRTSTMQPKNWYLVRMTSRSERFQPEWAWGLNDHIDGWALLLGKRGGTYVLTWERAWPGPQHSVRLRRVSGDDVGGRAKVTGLDIRPQSGTAHLGDYLAPRMVDAWPHV